MASRLKRVWAEAAGKFSGMKREVWQRVPEGEAPPKYTTAPEGVIQFRGASGRIVGRRVAEKVINFLEQHGLMMEKARVVDTHLYRYTFAINYVVRGHRYATTAEMQVKKDKLGSKDIMNKLQESVRGEVKRHIAELSNARREYADSELNWFEWDNAWQEHVDHSTYKEDMAATIGEGWQDLGEATPEELDSPDLEMESIIADADMGESPKTTMRKTQTRGERAMKSLMAYEEEKRDYAERMRGIEKEEAIETAGLTPAIAPRRPLSPKVPLWEGGGLVPEAAAKPPEEEEGFAVMTPAQRKEQRRREAIKAMEEVWGKPEGLLPAATKVRLEHEREMEIAREEAKRRQEMIRMAGGETFKRRVFEEDFGKPWYSFGRTTFAPEPYYTEPVTGEVFWTEPMFTGAGLEKGAEFRKLREPMPLETRREIHVKAAKEAYERRMASLTPEEREEYAEMRRAAARKGLATRLAKGIKGGRPRKVVVTPAEMTPEDRARAEFEAAKIRGEREAKRREKKREKRAGRIKEKMRAQERKVKRGAKELKRAFEKLPPEEQERLKKEMKRETPEQRRRREAYEEYYEGHEGSG